jgi:hypothetical protein
VGKKFLNTELSHEKVLLKAVENFTHTLSGREKSKTDENEKENIV